MSFLRQLLFATSAYLTLTNAIPLGTSASPSVAARNSLSKRANPQFGEGLDANDPKQGGRMVPAFGTAQQLLAYAIFSEKGIDSGSEIFKHYFKDDDKDKVKKAMLKLMGNPGSMDDAMKGEGAQ
ncbi:MAG: hypothetical protein Q9171_000712 [Xanthocarpia ochracea]